LGAGCARYWCVTVVVAVLMANRTSSGTLASALCSCPLHVRRAGLCTCPTNVAPLPEVWATAGVVSIDPTAEDTRLLVLADGRSAIIAPLRDDYRCSPPTYRSSGYGCRWRNTLTCEFSYLLANRYVGAPHLRTRYLALSISIRAYAYTVACLLDHRVGAPPLRLSNSLALGTRAPG
jgi:hypothetical protein